MLAVDFLIDCVCKSLYIVDPVELALDHNDPHPTYLTKMGPPIFFLLIVSKTESLLGTLTGVRG